MKKLVEQIPKWNEQYLEELKVLFGKLESLPNGPLRDYILEDCLELATAVLNKVLQEGRISNFQQIAIKKQSA